MKLFDVKVYFQVHVLYRDFIYYIILYGFFHTVCIYVSSWLSNCHFLVIFVNIYWPRKEAEG